jgi:hypothetical protein
VVTASKGAVALAAGPVGVLALATRKGRSRAPTTAIAAKVPTAPMAVPTVAPMAAATAKVLTTPTAGPAGALAPAVKKG